MGIDRISFYTRELKQALFKLIILLFLLKIPSLILFF